MIEVLLKLSPGVVSRSSNSVCVVRLCRGSFSVLCVSAGLGFEEAVLSVRASRVCIVYPGVQHLLRPLLLLMHRHRVSLPHYTAFDFL